MTSEGSWNKISFVARGSPSPVAACRVMLGLLNFPKLKLEDLVMIF